MSQEKFYSITIEVYRKSTYKIYSYKIENGCFEAVKLSTNKKKSKILIKKELTTVEQEDFIRYISKFPIEKLEENYTNTDVKGSHHLLFLLTTKNCNKEIYVYFKEQKDLKELYNMLQSFVPVNERFYYFSN